MLLPPGRLSVARPPIAIAEHRCSTAGETMKGVRILRAFRGTSQRRLLHLGVVPSVPAFSGWVASAVGMSSMSLATALYMAVLFVRQQQHGRQSAGEP